jgi:hypothetical protein
MIFSCGGISVPGKVPNEQMDPLTAPPIDATGDA